MLDTDGMTFYYFHLFLLTEKETYKSFAQHLVEGVSPFFDFLKKLLLIFKINILEHFNKMANR